jgi:hypothetical protein
LFRGDSVFIDQNLPGNSYTVTLDVIGPTTGSYAALTVGNAEATLALSAAAETLSVAGLTTLSAGTINISNTSTLSTGTFLGSGGTLSASDGLLDITGAATLSSGSFTVFNSGTLSAASLAVSGGTLNHYSTVNVAGDAAFTGGSDGQFGGTFTAGTLTVAGGSIDASIGTFTSTGATDLSSGTITVRNLATLNTGSLAVSGGELSQGDLTSTVNVTGNAAFTAGADAMSGGAFNADTLTVAGGSINTSGGNIRSKGATDLSSGTITIRDLATFNTATLSVAGGFFDDQGGTLTSNGATFLSSGSIAVSGSAALNTASLTVSGGQLTEDNASTVNVTGNAGFTGGTIGVFAGTFNAGTVSVGDGSNAQLLSLGAGTITVDDLTTINQAASVDVSGGSVTATGGISDLGSLSGFGTVDGGAISGNGTIQATGGTLDIGDTIVSGPTLSIDVNSTLKLGGTVTSAGAIKLGNPTRTLEIGSAGALTISQAQTIGSSTVKLDGGFLIDASGMAITGTGSIIGSGTIQADLADPGGLGFVEASGGQLAIDGNLSNTLTASIDNASTLSLGGTVGAGQIIDYGSNQSAELELNAGALTSFETNGTISGMSVGTGVTPTDVLDLTSINSATIASAGLHPDLTDETDYPKREAASCAPFVFDEGNVRPVWQRLAARAAALGQSAPRPDTTTDADLHILAKGRTIRPLYGEKGSYIFVLPKDATEVRVVSRAGGPADVRPWLDDRRCLGVYVERIVLRSTTEVRDVPIDHPSLSQGWWAAERNGTAMRRWTNGEAVLPLPPFHGPTMLEIRASNGGMAYLTGSNRASLAA